MSGGSGRGGLWVAVAIVLGVLGIAAWFTLGGGSPAYDAPGGDHALGKPAEVQAVAPTIHSPDAPEPTPLDAKPAPDAGRPAALVTAPVPGTAADGGHVVARGHVRWAGGKVPADSDVKLFDFEGGDVESTTTAEDGAYELTCEESLAAGWSFGTDPIDVPWKGGIATLMPTLVTDLPEHRVGDATIERDLVVGFAPTLTGRVTDKATGAPIAGAELHAVSTAVPYAFDVLDAETGPDGRYELALDNMPLTGLLVWCLADEHQATLAGPLDVQPVASPGDPQVQDFALAANITLRGHVTDARTHEPINGAIATVGSRYQAFSDASDFEVTDEAGDFELEAAEIPADGGWVVVTAADCAPALVPLAKGSAPLEVSLGAAFSVSGLVLDALGHAVPLARVQIAFDGDTAALDQQMYDQADCDNDGRFETTLELVPDQNALLIVEQVGKLPFRAKLSEVGRLLGGNRWEVELRLHDK